MREQMSLANRVVQIGGNRGHIHKEMKQIAAERRARTMNKGKKRNT